MGKKMKKQNKKQLSAKLASTTLVMALAFPQIGYSQDFLQLPAVNLGDTNFLDGVAGPGKLVQIFANSYHADQFNNANGDSLPGHNDLSSNALVAQFAMITDYKILGGNYGIEVLLPAYAEVDPDTSLPGLPTQTGTGTGNILFSPLLVQWSDSKLFGLPYQHRLNFVFHAPTGDYSKHDQINIGNNYWSFNPYYAGTLQLTEKISTSFRLHYLWNEENDDPAPFLGAKDTQVGDAFHMNFSASYAVTPEFRVGLAGYYVNQLSDDKIDGISQENSRESVFAIGPGLQYFSHKYHGIFDLNAYFESDAENRTEGHRVIARYRWLF